MGLLSLNHLLSVTCMAEWVMTDGCFCIKMPDEQAVHKKLVESKMHKIQHASAWAYLLVTGTCIHIQILDK